MKNPKIPFFNVIDIKKNIAEDTAERRKERKERMEVLRFMKDREGIGEFRPGGIRWDDYYKRYALIISIETDIEAADYRKSLVDANLDFSDQSATPLSASPHSAWTAGTEAAVIKILRNTFGGDILDMLVYYETEAGRRYTFDDPYTEEDHKSLSLIIKTLRKIPSLFEQRLVDGTELIAQFIIVQWHSIWEEWYDTVHDPQYILSEYAQAGYRDVFEIFKDSVCTPTNSSISNRHLDVLIRQPKSCLTLYNMIKNMDKATMNAIANSLSVGFGPNHYRDFTYEKQGYIWMDVPVYFNPMGTRYITSLSDYSRRVLAGFFWLAAENLFHLKMTGDREKRGLLQGLDLVGNHGGFPVPRFGYFSPIGYNPPTAF